MKTAKEILEQIEDLEHIYEMSNLRPRETNLPMVVWIKPKTGREKHGPRIKVQTFHGSKVDDEKLASVGFTPGGKITNFGGLKNDDFKLVSQFIQLNLDALMSLWNDEISPAEFMALMKKV